MMIAPVPLPDPYDMEVCEVCREVTKECDVSGCGGLKRANWRSVDAMSDRDVLLLVLDNQRSIATTINGMGEMVAGALNDFVTLRDSITKSGPGGLIKMLMGGGGKHGG